MVMLCDMLRCSLEVIRTSSLSLGLVQFSLYLGVLQQKFRWPSERFVRFRPNRSRSGSEPNKDGLLESSVYLTSRLAGKNGLRSTAGSSGRFASKSFRTLVLLLRNPKRSLVWAWQCRRVTCIERRISSNTIRVRLIFSLRATTLVNLNLFARREPFILVQESAPVNRTGKCRTIRYGRLTCAHKLTRCPV